MTQPLPVPVCTPETCPLCPDLAPPTPQDRAVQRSRQREGAGGDSFSPHCMSSHPLLHTRRTDCENIKSPWSWSPVTWPGVCCLRRWGTGRSQGWRTEPFLLEVLAAPRGWAGRIRLHTHFSDEKTEARVHGWLAGGARAQTHVCRL